MAFCNLEIPLQPNLQTFCKPNLPDVPHIVGPLSSNTSTAERLLFAVLSPCILCCPQHGIDLSDGVFLHPRHSPMARCSFPSRGSRWTCCVRLIVRCITERSHECQTVTVTADNRRQGKTPRGPPRGPSRAFRNSTSKRAMVRRSRSQAERRQENRLSFPFRRLRLSLSLRAATANERAFARLRTADLVSQPSHLSYR